MTGRTPKPAASPATGPAAKAEPAPAGPAENKVPIRRGPLLVDEVLTRIRQAIVQGDWALGQKISEARVAAAFGISKTPVREALVLLKREGLVEIRPQAGTFVFTLQPGELSEICEMRAVLESAALRRVIESGATVALAETLGEILDRMRAARQSGDVRTYLDLDGAFHHALCVACGNAYIIQGYALVEGKVAALRTHLGTDPHHLAKSFDEHCAIVEHLSQGAEADETLALLGRHIARKEGSYWEHLDESKARGEER
jgi:DNA-binding GntR family transcriptional regulator